MSRSKPSISPEDDDGRMTAGEFATVVRVAAGTVVRWGNAGGISTIRSPGGRKWYSGTEARRIARGEDPFTGEPR